MIGFSLANSFAWFAVVIIFHSIGYSSFSPAALSMFSSTAPLNRQGATMGFYGQFVKTAGLLQDQPWGLCVEYLGWGSYFLAGCSSIFFWGNPFIFLFNLFTRLCLLKTSILP